MKNWKVPAVTLILLILAMVFRWGNVSSSTNNGIATKTLVDRWNGAIWQETIKNGSYNEKIVNPSWFESMRKPVEKQVEYKESVYLKPPPRPDEAQNRFQYLIDEQNKTYEEEQKNATKTKTIQEPPPPIYWVSSNGITKIWGWLVLINVIWLLYAVGKTKKKDTSEGNLVNI